MFSKSGKNIQFRKVFWKFLNFYSWIKCVKIILILFLIFCLTHLSQHKSICMYVTFEFIYCFIKCKKNRLNVSNIRLTAVLRTVNNIELLIKDLENNIVPQKSQTNNTHLVHFLRSIFWLYCTTKYLFIRK